MGLGRSPDIKVKDEKIRVPRVKVREDQTGIESNILSQGLCIYEISMSRNFQTISKSRFSYIKHVSLCIYFLYIIHLHIGSQTNTRGQTSGFNGPGVYYPDNLNTQCNHVGN